MRTSWIPATILIAALAALPAARLTAQSGAGNAAWETLMRAPLPEDSEPKVSAFTLSPSPVSGPGHTHAGPIFAYILQGEIENQVEPDPPAIYKAGAFFYEPPMHVHRLLRNLSTTAPAKLIVFQAGRLGRTGQPISPAFKPLLEAPLPSTANQELSLLRLTLLAGARSEARAHSGPGIVYVLDGKIETSGAADPPKVYSAGDLFLEPADRAGLTHRNASDTEPAKLLLYQVSAKGAPGSIP
jgi:quercetin dioxygenase-like cupin family protein